MFLDYSLTLWHHCLLFCTAYPILRRVYYIYCHAVKIGIVKRAEAHAESSYLSGVGTARERAAIVCGMQESSQTLADATGADFEDVTDMLLVTQYLDTLVAIGANELILDPAPHALHDIQQGLPTVKGKKSRHVEATDLLG